MVKKVSSGKNPAPYARVTGWRSLIIQVLQIFINGLQSMQKLVEKTAPSITNADDISLKDIQPSINQQVTMKKDEAITEVTELVTEIADQSQENLVSLASEITTNIDAQINSIQEQVSANLSENLSDDQEPNLLTEVTEKVELVTDTVTNTVKKSVDVQSAKQQKTNIWHNLIYKIRSFMPKSWQAKLSDSMMTGLVTTTLVTILTVSIVIGATLIPTPEPSIALVQTDQNITLDNPNILNTDQSNISDDNLTKNSDVSAIQPEFNQSNTQIALIDKVSENKLTNNLPNNSELSEVNETPINQEKPNIINDLVANNIVAQVTENTEARLNSDQIKVDEQSLPTETEIVPENNQSSETTDDITEPDTSIVDENIKDNENIESTEPKETVNQLTTESTNNMNESLPPQATSDNDANKNDNDIQDENINNSAANAVKQTIPNELINPEPDLPVERTPGQTEPIKFTPEQYLVISIKNQIADITNRYGGGMVDSIQVNFLSGLLVIQVTDDWYDLDKTAQNQLANNLLKQAQDLDFTKLQIADTTGKLVARSPVVGDQMIILARSQSGIN